MLLLGSSILSILVSQYDDALSIAVAVIIVGSVGFYQEYKSEEALEALNNLVPYRCNTIRNGITKNILAEELVPGDIILLSSGDRIPADCRVLVSSGLTVDESSLTGIMMMMIRMMMMMILVFVSRYYNYISSYK